MRTGHKVAIAILLAVLGVHYSQQTAEEPSQPLFPKGLVVLILEETANRHDLPPEQLAALTSTSVREYLNAHCTKDENNNPEWRIVDKDVSMAAEPKPLQDAFDKAKSNPTPWLIVSNGRQGCSIALPKDTVNLLGTLQKYGGN